MKLGGHDVVEQSKIRFFHVDVHDFVIRPSNGLRQKAIDVGTERPNELVQNVKEVLLFYA